MPRITRMISTGVGIIYTPAPHQPPVFVVERRKIGHLLWERHHLDESMQGAETAKADYEKHYNTRAKKNYEFRIRETND